MGRVLQFPRQRSMGFFEPIDFTSLSPIHNRMPLEMRESIARMFFQHWCSVRRCAARYRKDGVTEFDVERIIREQNAKDVAKALNMGNLRTVPLRRAA